jgi:4-hydroxy-3-methylbut-2-enyl diphosphate reductase IspH
MASKAARDAAIKRAVKVVRSGCPWVRRPAPIAPQHASHDSSKGRDS